MTVAVPTILIVDSDPIIRSEIAAYLRDCAYEVIETVSSEEARQVLAAGDPIEVALIDARLQGSTDGFELAQWLRANKPEVSVILAASAERAAAAAGALCDEGLMLSRPYDPQIVVDRIKRLMASG